VPVKANAHTLHKVLGQVCWWVRFIFIKNLFIIFIEVIGDCIIFMIVESSSSYRRLLMGWGGSWVLFNFSSLFVPFSEGEVSPAFKVIVM
jgi:hypothetical protein